MTKYTADWIYPVSDAPIKNGVIITDDNGKILAVENYSAHDPSSVQHHTGVIIPGFINTHCHLELSHMKGLVPTGSTLIPFITEVVTKRGAPAQKIRKAIDSAEKEMIKNGIVAVGDISNTIDTFAKKAENNLLYCTFTEIFDFLQTENAETVFSKNAEEVFVKLILSGGSTKNFVPHAPYSVSKRLFELINGRNVSGTVSIHNQETQAEQDLFLNENGAFYNFYARFGVSLEKFKSDRKTPIHYAMANMNPALRTLFVHNTLTSDEDIRSAHKWSDNVFWATCPNANLYIENRLPNYKFFIEENARMTIGTDSLTSNWQLSVLEEMKTIQRFQSYVDFDTLLKWATLNGAQALGFDATLGSISVGKTPGLNVLNLGKDKILRSSTRVKKLI